MGVARMILNANQLPDGGTFDADICIVGAGPVGITMAQRLAGTTLRVVLLESGGESVAWPQQDLYRGSNVGLPYFALDMCQLRCLGGNTNAWGGWARPLDPLDFAHRPWVEHSGWPIAHAEMAAHLPEAHSLMQVERTEYAVEGLAELAYDGRSGTALFDPDLLVASLYRFSPPTVFGVAYRARLAKATNVTVMLHANVTRVLTDATGRTVEAMRVQTLGRKQFKVKARIFVMACGGIENARLLLNSTDACAEGLGNERGLVGRFFMEHPHIQRRMVIARDAERLYHFVPRFLSQLSCARIALPPALQESQGVLNYSASLYPDLQYQHTQAWQSFKRVVQSAAPHWRRTDPFFRAPPFHRKGIRLEDVLRATAGLDEIARGTFTKLRGKRQPPAGFVLESKPEQAPNPASRVTLNDERDEFGLRRVNLDWRMLPIDRRTVRFAEELVDRELRRLGLGELAPEPEGAHEGWPDNLLGGWHQLGTTRMAASDREGVVDRDARLFNVDNLYLMGQSVFPTGGAAPPTLTLLALALRLTEHLSERLNISWGRYQPVGGPALPQKPLSTVRARLGELTHARSNRPASAN